MLIIDVKALSDNICLGSNEEVYSKSIVLETIISLAVRYYNLDMDANEVTEVLDELNSKHNNLLVDIIFNDVYKDIVNHFKALGYDRRLHLKYNTKQIKGIIHKLIITMDLDSTIEKYKDKRETKPNSPITQIVEENPSQEILNALILRF